MEEKSRISRQQLLVLIGGCMIQSALIGIIVNTSGVFFTQMRTELGMSMTMIAAHNTIRAVVGALTGGYLSSLFFRVNKRIFLSIAVASIAVGYGLIAIGGDSFTWYIASCIIGLFVSMSMISISYVLSHWFPKGAGTTTGIASAFAGICGAVFSPIASSFIKSMGWSRALLAFCAIQLAVGLTGVFLMLPKSGDALFKTDVPRTADKGKKRERPDIPHLAARFALTVMVLTGSSIMLQFIFNVSVFAQTLGYPLEVGARLTSMVMIGNITGKLMFGAIEDRSSVWKSEMVIGSMVSVSILAFIFCTDNLAILSVASVVYGFAYSLSSVGLSRCCASAYGKEGQKSMVGYHVSISNAAGAIISLAIGIVYDKFGSYNPVLYIAFGASLLLIVSAFIVERIIKRDGPLE